LTADFKSQHVTAYWSIPLPPPYAPSHPMEPAQPSQGECEACKGRGLFPFGDHGTLIELKCGYCNGTGQEEKASTHEKD
jgi:hypothetical protein